MNREEGQGAHGRRRLAPVAPGQGSGKRGRSSRRGGWLLSGRVTPRERLAESGASLLSRLSRGGRRARDPLQFGVDPGKERCSDSVCVVGIL